MSTTDDLLQEFERAPAGASPESIAAAAKALGVRFPDDYVALMQASNGGEGPVGSHGYLRLWPVEELVESNEGYRAREFFPGHVLIGTNGGGDAIALRKGIKGVEIVLLPFVGGVEDALLGGTTLVEFLEAYGTGAIWPSRGR